MRTIAIINQKGGCGKTTVSIHLAAVLASMGRRTLLVDMDPQSHCSVGLGVPEASIDRSMADLLRAGLDGSIAFADILYPINRSLDLAPSHVSLAGIEQLLSSASDKDRRLTQVLSTVDDQYDFAIIDCPPAIGLLTFNALRAAQEVIIPVETGYFSLKASLRQEETIRMLARRVGHQIRLCVLATMCDVRSKLGREILSELERHFADRLLPTIVNFNTKLKEAAYVGRPITEYDPDGRCFKDFEQLAQWLLANPPVPEPNPATTNPAANPVLSRAAELVERARALSARTATLAGRAPVTRDLDADPGQAQLAMTQEVGRARAAAQEKLAQFFGVRNTTQGILFVQPAHGAKQVAIAGDFNDWNPASCPLQRDEKLGVWKACVDMPPGRYRYRIVVDGQWMQDPYNKYVEVNPFGELNSVIEAQPND